MRSTLLAAALVAWATGCADNQQPALEAGGVEAGAALDGTDDPAVAAPLPPSEPPDHVGVLAAAVEANLAPGAAGTLQVVADRRAAAPFEQKSARRALADLQADLVQSCRSPSATGAFGVLQQREAAAFAADREVIVALLELAGAEGRAAIWERAGVVDLLASSRSYLAGNLNADLPGLTDQSAYDADVHRAEFAMELVLQANSAELELRMDSFLGAAGTLRPDDPDTPERLELALAALDQALIDVQREKFEVLSPICQLVGQPRWVPLLEGDAVARYVSLVLPGAPPR